MAFRHAYLVVAGSDFSVSDLKRVAPRAPGAYVQEGFSFSYNDDGWVSLMVTERLLDIHHWAQAISLDRGGIVVSFLVLEGTWAYSVFDSGRRVLDMQTYPEPMPVLNGDVRRAATLLGVDEEVFVRYYDLLVHASVSGDEGELAYADDEYPAADEYGFESFAARIGVPFDPPFDDSVVHLRWEPIDPNATSWHLPGIES